MKKLLICLLLIGSISFASTDEFIVSHVYSFDEQNPFEKPIYIRVIAVKDGWVQYKFCDWFGRSKPTSKAFSAHEDGLGSIFTDTKIISLERD